MQAPKLVTRLIPGASESPPLSNLPFKCFHEVFKNSEPVILYHQTSHSTPEYAVLRISLVENSSCDTSLPKPITLMVTLHGGDREETSRYTLQLINMDGVLTTPGGIGCWASAGVSWDEPAGYTSVCELINREKVTASKGMFLYTSLDVDSPRLDLMPDIVGTTFPLTPMTQMVQILNLENSMPKLTPDEVMIVALNGKRVWHFTQTLLYYIQTVYKYRLPVFLIPVACTWNSLALMVVNRDCLEE